MTLLLTWLNELYYYFFFILLYKVYYLSCFTTSTHLRPSQIQQSPTSTLKPFSQIYITCRSSERVTWCVQYTHRTALHNAVHCFTASHKHLQSIQASTSLTFETKSNFTVKCNKSRLASGYVWLLGDLKITLIRLQHWSTASRQCRLFWWMMWNKI